MAVKNFGKALKYTDRQLGRHEYDRAWVHDFWVNETSEGQAIRTAGTYGESASHARDDKFFLNVIVDNVQRFVFGDQGDSAMGVPEAPATEKELDGMVGPMTIRRMETWLEFSRDKVEPEVAIDTVPEMTASDFMVFNGKRIVVPGVEIVSFDEPGGLDLVAKAKARAKKKRKRRASGYSKWPKDVMALAGKHWKYARLNGFVHWDAGWSAHGAFKMLVRRGLGTNCGIDRPRLADGKVIAYQWLDPGKFYGWHGSSANPRSIMSFDMSNAVYGKYASKYRKLCGIDRPLLKISSREKIGSGKVFLGMYKDQIITLMRILKALSEHTGLPYHWPVNKKGKFVGRNYKRLWKDPFHGTAEHRMLPSTSKWDCRGLFAQIVALILSVPALMAEFPEFVEAHRLHDARWGPWLDKVKKHWEWKELWG